MTAAHDLNGTWSAAIMAWLRAAGLAEIVLCPGNRNLPLMHAAIDDPQIVVHQHVDERAAAFIALGLAQASGRPVAICCTSGSAVANCLPALVEAHASRLPLILLTADRPAHLHGCEAPQCMQQTGIFTTFLAAEAALPDPGGDLDELDATLASALRALASGPVQINVPLDDPLVPAGPSPLLVRSLSVEPQPVCDALPPACISSVASGRRGLIVAGPRCPLDATQVDTLSRATGFPVLADACSGLRRPAVGNLITAGQLLTRDPQFATAELVIRLGPAPIARASWEWCRRQTCPVIRIDDHPVAADHCAPSFAMLTAPSDACLAELAQACGQAPAAWTTSWLAAEAAAQERIAALVATGWHELAAVASCCDAQRGGLIQLANSLAVRHADLVCRPQTTAQTIVANRGVNGIDGTLASFFGRCCHRPGPQTLIVGDLAAFHDQTSLHWAVQMGLQARIVLIDNDGGRIFDLLPVAAHPALHRHVRAATPVDWSAVATAHGASYRPCTGLDDLEAALRGPASGVEILHCHAFDRDVAAVMAELR